ncbi:polyketide cyclase [Allostella vacuolata]|nr:polyketide cyclase [Stella vacuolata]
MAIALPDPIARYFASETAPDRPAVEGCFAPDATVRDEGRSIRGIDAILEWRAEAIRKYAHTSRPVGLVERDGRTVVAAEVAGNFPGSPVTLDHVFELADGRIRSLKIG